MSQSDTPALPHSDSALQPRRENGETRELSGKRQIVYLTKKFAEMIDGIDLSRAKVGEYIELSEQDAQILIAEGWARPISANELAVAADKPPRRPRRSKQRSTSTT